MILDEVSGHRRRGGDASFLLCKNKVGPTPKEYWKGANGDKNKAGRGKEGGYTIPLCEVRGGRPTPRHLWNTVVFGLPP